MLHPGPVVVVVVEVDEIVEVVVDDSVVDPVETLEHVEVSDVVQDVVCVLVQVLDIVD